MTTPEGSLPDAPGGEVVLYQTEDGQTRVDVHLLNETVWLNLNQMAELFQRDKSVISRHLRNLFAEGELEPESTVADFATVQTEGGRGVSRIVTHYNLDVIISVGYRVKSHRGTQFRIWATQRLREYIVKGFAMDDARLKCGDKPGYFDELLERVRDIRSSERLFYQKVLDIYATSLDYDPALEISSKFFAAVQNKMHWAAHGHTAAEVVHQRADAGVPGMGLTSWAGDRPRKFDVTVAKNYLQPEEIHALNLIVVLYLDFAELQATSRKTMTMHAWVTKLDEFLRLSDREVLKHAGKVTHAVAVAKAEAEYERLKLRERNLPQPVDRHFEEAVKRTKQLGNRDIP